MTIKEYDLIKEMLQMQKKLDEAIMEEYGLTEIDEENLRMAILDETGELTHELKGNWCWWKKTQAPVDKQKVLGELVIFESSIIPVLIAISEYLGFTIEQVYECYCYKNKINYQRLKEGY